MSAAVYFDRLAERYQDLWSDSPIGLVQRAAVWRELDGLFRPGDHILDLGCGAGDDALHLARAHVRVTGVDISGAMLRVARSRALDEGLVIDWQQADLESLDGTGAFDGALSNFGALNCIADLPGFAARLAARLRRGAPAALCLMSRCCAWEWAWYLAVGQPARAFRRLRAGGAPAGDWRVRYPSAAALRRAFAPHFRLLRRRGIGLCVPPSYAGALARRYPRALGIAGRLDAHLALWPVLRNLADHQLFVFERR